MQLEKFQQTRAALCCKKCQAKGTLVVKRCQTHWGQLICGICGAWFDWLAKPKNNEGDMLENVPPRRKDNSLTRAEKGFAEIAKPGHVWGPPLQKEKVPRYTPNQIAHPITLEERVASLEHDLGIIAQIVIGKQANG